MGVPRVCNNHMRETDGQLFARLTARAHVPGPGLGDVVAGATKAVGIKPCAGCQKRQAAMNRATPSYVRRVLAWLRAAPVPRFRPSRRP